MTAQTTSFNVRLTEPLAEFVEGKVAEDGYGSAGEYVRQLVRDAKRRNDEQKLERELLETIGADEIQLSRENWDRVKRQVVARRLEELRREVARGLSQLHGQASAPESPAEQSAPLIGIARPKL